MRLEYRASFLRDLRRVRDAEIRRRVSEAIAELEAAPSLSAGAGVERLTAPGHYYRLRIRTYRLGMELEGDTLILRRLLHRREIYRYFP